MASIIAGLVLSTVILLLILGLSPHGWGNPEAWRSPAVIILWVLFTAIGAAAWHAGDGR